MDTNLPQLFTAGGITGTVIAVIYIGYKLFRKSKCTANCCGRKLTLDYTVGEQQSVRMEQSPAHTAVPIVALPSPADDK